MHEVEREVYDYFDDDDDMNEVRRLELERKEERIRELKHQQRKRREQEKDSERRNRRSSAVDEDDDEEVRIGVERYTCTPHPLRSPLARHSLVFVVPWNERLTPWGG
jgi:hypothetical protein